MDYPEIEEFTAPQYAFEDKSQQGLMSQAAFLLPEHSSQEIL